MVGGSKVFIEEKVKPGMQSRMIHMNFFSVGDI